MERVVGRTFQEERALCARVQKEGLCHGKFGQLSRKLELLEEWGEERSLVGLVRDKAKKVYRSWV